ncbi:hypothetical protein [Mycolicibacterium iranicum]|uniref:Uncharacterized protein n=1 Tax=Mycolicibacterium iranicum TaxID=912594 RepID=A0ABT4HJU0_MYCIR|nr:hypothetical protein [Mycolicibacterium iranicum]MCZ0730476.1 hypothetical protein [Mycolicibacterium iranicum]
MTATHPPLDGLPEGTLGALFVLFDRIARSRSGGFARWADAMANVISDRLHGTDLAHAPEPLPLSVLHEADILAAAPWLAEVATTGVDRDADRWLKSMAVLMRDHYRQRRGDQALIDAQVAAIDAEFERERQEQRPQSDLSGIPPWSEASQGGRRDPFV